MLGVFDISYHTKKNVPWHILAPRRGCFGNHLPLRRVRILAERFCMIGRNFLSYKKNPVKGFLRVDKGIRTLGLQSHNLAR